MRLAVAAAALVLLFREVPISEVTSSARMVRTAPLVLALSLSLASQIFVAERLSFLLGRLLPGVRRSAVLEVNLTALFYALFLPAGNASSFVIRFVRLVPDRSRWADVGGTLVLDRIAASVVLAGVGLAAWLLDPLGRSLPVGTLLTVSTVGFLLAVLFLQSGIRLPAPTRQSGKLGLRWITLPRSLRPNARSWLPILGLTLVAHGLGILAYGAVARALGMSVGLLSMAWVRSGMMLAAMLPVSFAGLGLREGAALLLLALLAVDPDVAVAFSLLVFATTVLGVGLFGGLIEAVRQARALRA